MLTLRRPPTAPPRRRRRLLGLAAAVTILLALAGHLYERYAWHRDFRAFPAPGRFVDIGGRVLHVLCIGEGAPTVVFEAGGFMNSVSATAVRTELSKRTRVCSYDRVGAGWSQAAPDVLTIGALSDDLRRLQDAARLEPPFVIVASSMGGLVADMFARRHPDRVAGLVLLDVATSDGLAQRAATMEGVTLRAMCTGAVTAGRVGLVRLIDPFKLRSAAADNATRSAALMYGAQPWRTVCSLVRGASASLREFDAAPPLRADLPLVVLTAESSAGLVPPALAPYVALESLTPRRREMHAALARRSSRGSWRVVPRSDHLIVNSRPDAVVEAVIELLGPAR